MFVAALTVVAASGCREQGGTFVPKADSGMMVASCNTNADCGGRGICVSGICEAVTSCTTDDQCSGEGKVCHSRRFYCVECDGTHQDECPSGQTCQFDFTCVMIGGGGDGGVGDGATTTCSGSCTDRTMCGPDQVCTGGQCCPPPARCFSPADCPTSRPECNGATGQCFGGDSCVTDNDCSTRPGCAANACVCELASGTCRMRPDECQSDQDCRDNGAYTGKFCTITSPPRRCLTAPSCVSNADCVQSGLICDLTAGSDSINKCVNGRPCPMGNECNPTTESCDRGVCVPRSCINSPSLCGPTEMCNPTTGLCEQNSSGTCTVDADCPADRWCNTFLIPASCQLGCRDNSSCVPPQVCDASHQCAGGAGMVCSDCTTDAECPAGTECNMFLGKCYERCDAATMQMCTLRQGVTCNMFGYCSCLGM